MVRMQKGETLPPFTNNLRACNTSSSGVQAWISAIYSCLSRISYNCHIHTHTVPGLFLTQSSTPTRNYLLRMHACIGSETLTMASVTDELVSLIMPCANLGNTSRSLHTLAAAKWKGNWVDSVVVCHIMTGKPDHSS